MFRTLLALALIGGEIAFLVHLNRLSNEGRSSPLDKLADRVALLVTGKPRETVPVPARSPDARRVADAKKDLTEKAPAPLPQPTAALTVHVAPGETLYRLAVRHLGDGKRHGEIASLNKLRPGAVLKVGQQLKIPVPATLRRVAQAGGPQPRAASSAPAPNYPARPATYTIRKGDSLSTISTRCLGSASRWKELARLNQIRDPANLKVGQILQIPGPPQVVRAQG